MQEQPLSPVARIAAITAQFEALQKETAPQRAEQQEKQAAAARSGSLGVEWQKVQQRIDMNQTTLQDVFNGTDESAEATALRAKSQHNLEEFGKKLAEDAEDDPAATDPAAELRGMAENFAARVEAMRNGWRQ